MTYQRDAQALQASATSIQDNGETNAPIQKGNFDGLPEAQANGDYKDPVEWSQSTSSSRWYGISFNFEFLIKFE